MAIQLRESSYGMFFPDLENRHKKNNAGDEGSSFMDILSSANLKFPGMKD